jgi:hypothetical protein
MKIKYLFLLLFISCAASKSSMQPAPKPVYVDPIYDGAADPVVVWNNKEKKWFMLYTNRRANMADTTGVRWVHGTRIGIAESKDGAIWKYRDTANINYRPVAEYTHWAPEVIEHDGIYHMYLTYVPGIFNDWNHPRNIVHLTSPDLFNWKFESVLPLVNEKVIDACVIALPGGGWRLWYNNERDGKSIWYADSKDLYTWQDKGKAIPARGEGPKVFKWKDTYWMIIDAWKGMEVYQSNDLLAWKKQSTRILEEPGKGKDDQAIGGHCDVVVNDGHAWIYYFTHPGRSKLSPPQSQRRSVIHVTELKYNDGVVSCNRDEPVYIQLKH